MSSLVRYLFPSIAYFLIELFVFPSLSFRSSWYIFDNSSLSQWSPTISVLGTSFVEDRFSMACGGLMCVCGLGMI